ncbi:MAG: fumarylacetoacetate hydrolase family protein [Bacteroidetes bacterium]|jgi:acylpyruvate hydrolase|nr:fumarylacetoacetate hydrolase family protein [Bacteroidota bacterium]MBT5529396.1 fumarylacetoacetate hydrolase family protein [Cytophagia bacterium]MBT3422298.1 fumarylacetoacetate hydrolase family protein [Bacteroidota bacterium]MBT3800709.1 fumarylacetoacetate hydrolase family protein [Bacteroidota bacterium]MBT3932745.1 fumarylacetoacetate hydrolase family protein [Bacteroidota bacterium]
MKIICVGRNYVKHIEELKNVVLEEPAIFLKPDSALIKGEQVFEMPSFSSNIHHELELVLKIDKKGKNILLEDALNYYSEIALGLDFTARDIQDKLKDKKLSWELSKAFDNAAAIGKFVSLKQLSNPEQIQFHLIKNEDLVQKGKSTEMIFNFDFIISFISRFFTLETGDLIYTGTPAGVGPIASGDILRGYLDNNLNLELKVK